MAVSPSKPKTKDNEYKSQHESCDGRTYRVKMV